MLNLNLIKHNIIFKFKFLYKNILNVSNLNSDKNTFR